MSDVTRILNDNDPDAVDQLLPIVYDELRKLAAARMSREQPGQSLAPTGLVHEAWLRLVGNETDWTSRGHFFSAAAEAMRRILVERARQKQSLKGGGGRQRIELADGRKWRLKSRGWQRYVCPTLVDAKGLKLATSAPGIEDYAITCVEK